MEFLEGELYHIYNRGNNKEKIFFYHENYLFFLRKIKVELLPYCDILAYCLMPNHYHLLVHVKQGININNMHPLSRKIGTLQSSYTQAINKQENRKGSLFQQNAKSKQLDKHAFICFHYIHQNPIKANLCRALEGWVYSSFQDYFGMREGTLPSKGLAYELLEIPNDPKEFYVQSLQVINEEMVDLIF